MIIAVTDDDESNMLACQIAYTLFHTPTKVARIRASAYLTRTELFQREHVPIDVIISPEQAVTERIAQLLVYPGALQVLNFANDQVKLIAVKAYYGSLLLGKTIQQLLQVLSDNPFRVVAIFRDERSIVLKDDTVIELGDEVFFVTDTQYVDTIMSSFVRAEQPYRRIMIAGGGHIGLRLARTLEDQYQIKMIELNRERCELLAEKLQHAIVLCGDCCDKNLLIDENIEDTDAFCALTNDDEVNIIASLQAKRLGVRRVMTLITQTAYVDLIEGGSINIAISPQQATVGSILKHIRRGDVVKVHSLRRGAAEAIEAVAHGDSETSKVVGRKVNDIKLPSSADIGAIVRKHQVIIPEKDTIIQAEDHLILFVSDKKHVREVEKLFQVSATFF